jgi:uncharacterized protein YdeI (YjbR/CyaY-like superfamily)
MEGYTELYFTGCEEWRQWLSENHDKSSGIWLVFYNKESGKPTLKYDEAVETALCFGWIDSTIKNLDSEKYVRKLIPRKDFYNWSPSNRERVECLIKSGQMTPIGLNKIGDYAKTGKLAWPEIGEKPKFPPLAPGLFEMLKQNQVAFSNYTQMSPSHQKRYAQWVMSAKLEETRLKRMKEAITLLEKNFKNLIK